MKHKNFILRTVNLLAILAVLLGYQQIAAARAAEVAQRQQQIDEVEAYNAAILQEQAQSEPEQDGYRDGKMTDISVLSADGEDKPYYNQALPLLDKMLSAQSAGVDTVSGATLTSEGLIGAVEDALGKAGA